MWNIAFLRTLTLETINYQNRGLCLALVWNPIKVLWPSDSPYSFQPPSWWRLHCQLAGMKRNQNLHWLIWWQLIERKRERERFWIILNFEIKLTLSVFCFFLLYLCLFLCSFYPLHFISFSPFFFVFHLFFHTLIP